MTDKLRDAAPLLPCPFCGDDGDKGTQAVTLMNAERTSFRRVSCRCCGATCPEPNWNHRAALAQQDAQAAPQGWGLSRQKGMVRGGILVTSPDGAAWEVCGGVGGLSGHLYAFLDAVLNAAPTPPAQEKQS